MPPLPRATWEILVAENASSRRSFILNGGSLLIGASPGCAIVASSPGVAPRHAEFVATPETLQLRVFEETPPVLLNEATVRGLVDVPCPATVQIGSLHISVKAAAAPGPSMTNPDSTLRLVHPARPDFGLLADPDHLEVTGRIVCRLPGAEDNASPGTADAGAKDAPLRSTAVHEESTMAFSMEDPEVSIPDKVPVRMDYDVKGEIARGGMGRIFSAEDTALDRHVALKMSTVGDPAREPQFFREAKILAALAHPNIVPIHSVGVDTGGRPFYSMKLIQGRTLQAIIKQLASGDRQTAEDYPRMRLLDIFRKVCDAVSFAHSKGYLHRDLKPDNIMVGEFGEVLVMDWGIAKAIRRPGEGTSRQATGEDEPETLPYIEGTPQYMSPEQANGVYGGLDERSDIYSLGGILYAILTLRPPVSGSSLNEVLEKVRNGETTNMAMPRGAVKSGPTNRDALRVPDALRAVTFKALAKDRDRRYGSVAELARDIEAYIGGFATQAEGAGLARHLVLLVKRHRLASALAGAAIAGTLMFTAQLGKKTAQLAKSEKRANDSADLARQEAARATRNADEARSNAALAAEKARIAEENEQKAKQEKEEARKAQSRTQIALAEAAEQAQNAAAMQRALDGVPEDLRDQTWRYLSTLADSAEVTIENKASSAWHKFEPHPLDPDLIFTLHDDGWIQTVNLKTGVMKPIIQTAATQRIQSRMAISPDARSAAVSSSRGNRPIVDILDLQTGATKSGFAFPQADRLPYLKFSKPGNSLLISVPATGVLGVFDIPQNTLRWSKELKWPGLAYFSENEKSVLVFPVGKTPVELDALNGNVTRQNENDGFKSTSQSYEAYSLSPDRTKIFGVIAGALRMHELGSGIKQFDERLPAAADPAAKLSLSAREGPLVTLSAVSDGAAVLCTHNVADGQALQSRFLVMKKSLGVDWTLVTHPLSRRIAVARGDTLKVWSIPTPNETALLTLQLNAVKNCFWFSKTPAEAQFVQWAKRIPPNKTEMQLAKKNLEKSLAEKPAASLTLGVDKDTHPVPRLSTNSLGNLICIQFLQDNTLFILQDRNNTLHEIHRFKVTGYSTFTEMSPSGRFVWSALGAIETASGNPLQKLDRKNLNSTSEEIPPVWLGESHVAEILLSQDAESQNKGELKRSIALWSVKENAPAAIVDAPEANALAASPDGSQIAEAGRDMRVRLREGKTLEVVKILRVHDGPVVGVAWHPTLPLLATASEDHSVRIWDLRTETLVEEFRIHLNRAAMNLRWSPDGRFLGVSHLNPTDNLKIYEPKACKEADRPGR